MIITRRIVREVWTLIGVYAPQTKSDKTLFMQEIRAIQPTTEERWLLLGDFNLICRSIDKSSRQINMHLMNSFSELLEDTEMKEIPLHDRWYTWSSGTQSPTQTKIDHMFSTKEWEFLYSNCHLQVGSTSVSDHCALILTCKHLREDIMASSLKLIGFSCWSSERLLCSSG
jgi:endonuclease/exonuclease/phosphatase family metal-dependent hydrolase